MPPRHRLALLAAAALPACSAPPPPSQAAAPPVVLAPPAAPAARARAPAAASAPDAAAPVYPCMPGTVVDAASVIEPIVRGSFSAPGQDEVTGEIACDDNETAYGLWRRAGDRLELLRTIPRGHREGRFGCRALRARTGRDLLICRYVSCSWGWIGEGVGVTDYKREQEQEVVDLVGVTDTTGGSCAQRDAARYVTATLERFEIVEVGGAPGVRVRLGAAPVRLPGRPDCQPGNCGGRDPHPVPPPPMQVVEFRLQGETLVPTPRSARVMAEIAKLGH